MRKQVAVAVLSILALMIFAPAAEAAVLRVVVVETADAAAYAKEIAKGQVMLERLETGAIVRVWRARFAGTDTGKVVVSIEYADMATLVKAETKAMADAEYTAWLAGLAKIRKVVSDSTYEELGN